MKTIFAFVAAALLTGCASNRLVRYEECPVTPAKMRADKLNGYGPFYQDTANNEGRY